MEKDICFHRQPFFLVLPLPADYHQRMFLSLQSENGGGWRCPASGGPGLTDDARILAECQVGGPASVQCYR